MSGGPAVHDSGEGFMSNLFEPSHRVLPPVDDHQVDEPPGALDSGPVTLYHRDGHRIWAQLNTEGALVISGQDLRPPNGWEEYEYEFSIPAEDLPRIREGLDGSHDDTILGLLATKAEKIAPAVKSWLDAVGASYKFWNRIEQGHT
jgi:hypothetical protein